MCQILRAFQIQTHSNFIIPLCGRLYYFRILTHACTYQRQDKVLVPDLEPDNLAPGPTFLILNRAMSSTCRRWKFISSRHKMCCETRVEDQNMPLLSCMSRVNAFDSYLIEFLWSYHELSYHRNERQSHFKVSTKTQGSAVFLPQVSFVSLSQLS